MERLQPVAQIQYKVRKRQYRLTSHAEQERESDKITIQEIEEALLSHQIEVIESYPEDIRGRSCLILGFAQGGNPLHVGWEQRSLLLSQYIVLTQNSGQTGD